LEIEETLGNDPLNIRDGNYTSNFTTIAGIIIVVIFIIVFLFIR